MNSFRIIEANQKAVVSTVSKAANSVAAAPKLTRDEYGQLVSTPTIAVQLADAYVMVADAAAKGKIPRAYDRLDWERVSSRVGRKLIGTARSLDIYDIAANGNKVLVCVRDIVGTRYGVATTGKAYFIVGKCGTGYRVRQASKTRAARLAKASNRLGDAIKAL